MIPGETAYGAAVLAVAAWQQSEEVAGESADAGTDSPFALYLSCLAVSDYIFRGINQPDMRAVNGCSMG